MSGLFGVIDSKREYRVDSQLRSMGRMMAHKDWYVVDLHSDEEGGLGLGRIGIGLHNREKQPVLSSDGNLICFFCGELSNSIEIRRELGRQGHPFMGRSDADLILKLYAEKGTTFLREIEGKFVLAIWNRSNESLLVANDIFGLYPLLYSHFKGRLIFSPEMKGILCDPEFRKEIDLTALAEYMRFQVILGERSFFKGIKFLPSASVLLYKQKTDELTIEPYWDFSEAHEERMTFEDAVDEAGRLLKRAVNRMFASPLRPGLFLSGGLDSRALISLIDQDFYPLVTVSYGRKESRDVVYAHRISKELGGRHHWFCIQDGKWVQNQADFHLEVTEGFHSWVHMRELKMLSRTRQILDVALFGFGSSAVFALTVPVYDREPVDELDFVRQAHDFMISRHTWPSVTDAEEACLYTDDFYKQIRGLAFSSFREEIDRYKNLRYELRAGALRIRNNQIKFFYYFLLFCGSHFEVYLPYYDYRVARFGLSLPLWMKKEKKIFRALINRFAPRLGRVPNEKDGLIISEKWFYKYPQWIGRRLMDRFNRHVYPFFPSHPNLDIDYESFLRSDLKDWGESILFDRRTSERGIFNPDFLRSIWGRHLSGAELSTIGKIAPIMTYEMMLRRFYD